MSFASNCYSTEVQLTSSLLNTSRYNPIVPLTESGTSQGYRPSIHISFVLVKFLSLTSDTRIFSTQGVLDIYWADPQLAWNATNYKCIKTLHYYAYSVWHPYVYLKGASGSYFRYSMDQNDIIYQSGATQASNGRIYGLFQSSCPMSLLYYPFDHQGAFNEVPKRARFAVSPRLPTCYLKFINYDDQWIEWTVKGDGIFPMSVDATSNSDWSVTSVFANSSTDVVCLSFGCTNISLFTVTFNLQRKSAYYIINLVAPTVIMWVMISLTFVLPTDRGVKVPLAATLMLAIYTQQKTVSSLLPNASPTPYISQIYLIGIYLSALSLITAVLSILMRVLAPALPHGVQVFMINVVGRLCCQGKPRVGPKPNDSKDFVLTESEENLTAESAILYQKLACIDNRLGELILMKKEKIARAEANTANENAWQKIEFVFNAFLLVGYIVAMAILFCTFAQGGGTSLL